ncbi:DUF3592 domain-containing protein [Cellulomonas chengniuliangii]|uniref:DUF3592 domain-containing protein n=1 Tax=Cellulomonas chengniuliangii TaxID=2968084 RepID=UPI001D0ECF64|nr:DUF3592 domain-containing protein [Cellulomonas chengniuliangii]MCC2318465.1 DUF3592 domain-containing protein [Cellulomonas chengniuliangii]
MTIRDVLAIPLGLLCTAALVGLTLYGATGVLQQDVLVRDLRAHGDTTPGVITTITEGYSPRSGVSYRREVAYLDGLTTHDTLRCRCSAVGDSVTVVYDKDHPARAMTGSRLDGWSRLVYLPATILLALAIALVSLWVASGSKLAAWKYRVIRYGDPRAHAQKHSRNAREYIAFVNTHQRRPEATSGEPAEAALASWWMTIQTDAPDTREARLVADVLTITRL